MTLDTQIETAGLEVMTFDLHGETFALEASLVREVLDLVPETEVPGAPVFVASVVNFRGRVIPLADLRLAFDLKIGPTTRDSRIVVIEFDIDGEPTMLGLRADKVHEVTTIQPGSMLEIPRVGLRWRQDFIRILARRDDDLVIVPDLHVIFGHQQDIDRPAVSTIRH